MRRFCQTNDFYILSYSREYVEYSNQHGVDCTLSHAKSFMACTKNLYSLVKNVNQLFSMNVLSISSTHLDRHQPGLTGFGSVCPLVITMKDNELSKSIF